MNAFFFNIIYFPHFNGKPIMTYRRHIKTEKGLEILLKPPALKLYDSTAQPDGLTSKMIDNYSCRFIST